MPQPIKGEKSGRFGVHGVHGIELRKRGRDGPRTNSAKLIIRRDLRTPQINAGAPEDGNVSEVRIVHK